MKEELETMYMPPYFYESRPSPSIQSHRSKIIIPPLRDDIKDHSNEDKKKSPLVKCDNSQGYGHRVDTCASLFRVVIIDTRQSLYCSP